MTFIQGHRPPHGVTVIAFPDSCELRLLGGGDGELSAPGTTALARDVAALTDGPLTFRDLDVLDDHAGTTRSGPPAPGRVHVRNVVRSRCETSAGIASGSSRAPCPWRRRRPAQSTSRLLYRGERPLTARTSGRHADLHRV
jgi:hypothetical protein